MVGVWEGVKREPGEEVKKRRVEERTESGGAEFPLVPFLRRLNQIPTPSHPHTTLMKPETVQLNSHNHHTFGCDMERCCLSFNTVADGYCGWLLNSMVCKLGAFPGSSPCTLGFGQIH